MNRKMLAASAGQSLRQHYEGVPSDTEYVEWINRVQARFQAASGTKSNPIPLFYTRETRNDQTPFDIYLNGMPVATRQHHNCSACRHFFNHFSGLVQVQEDGSLKSALFDLADTPEYYRPSISKLLREVEHSTITRPFYTELEMLGTRQTGLWHHMAVVPVTKTEDAGAVAARKVQDLEQVRRAIIEFPQDVLNKAVTLLDSDMLYRSEKVIAPATWLRDVAQRWLDNDHTKARGNLLWDAVVRAPAGFCHPRTSMIGTLLEDLMTLKCGQHPSITLDVVVQKFKAKMNPLDYQRPQAPPKAGTIAQAGKLVEELGITDSLRRRWMDISEVEHRLWNSYAEQVDSSQAPTGIFNYLLNKSVKTPELVSGTALHVSWHKFSRDVMPTAQAIQYSVPPSNENYVALVTSAVEGSKPIMQWDYDEARNPVSWYTYANRSYSGSQAAATPEGFNLPRNSMVNVLAITKMPHEWGTTAPQNMTAGVIFLLEGCKDMNNPGLALFPENMKSFTHGIRSVIEAHSASTPMESPEGLTPAAGLMLSANNVNAAQFQVLVGGVRFKYIIDRWE